MNKSIIVFPMPELGRGSSGYFIQGRLPVEYGERVAILHGSDRFCELVVEGLRRLFGTGMFRGVGELRVFFSDHGIYLQLDSSGDVSVYIPPGSSEITCHNVDTYEQASVLYLALTTYLATVQDYLSVVDGEPLTGERRAYAIPLHRVREQRK